MPLNNAWDAVARCAWRSSAVPARFPYETARWVDSMVVPSEDGRRRAYDDLQAAGVWYVREVLLNPDPGSSDVRIPPRQRGPVYPIALSFVRQWLSWREQRDAEAMLAATDAAGKAARAAAVVALLSLCAGVWQGHQSKRQADFAKWQLRASVSQELQKACEQGQQKACEQLESRLPPSNPVRRGWWPWRRAG